MNKISEHKFTKNRQNVHIENIRTIVKKKKKISNGNPNMVY